MHPSPEPGVPRSGRFARLRAVFWAGLAVAALLAAGDAPAARAEDAPRPSPSDPAPTSLQTALLDLDSPFQTVREAAVARLTDALPAARGAVLEAFRAGTPPRRALLARVLSADAGP